MKARFWHERWESNQLGFHRALLYGLVETWPPGSGFVLVPGAKKRFTGYDVHVDARTVLVPVFVLERPLGAFLLGHLVLQRRQAGFQLLVRGPGVVG